MYRFEQVFGVPLCYVGSGALCGGAPLFEQNDRQTRLKTYPCRKLGIRVVMKLLHAVRPARKNTPCNSAKSEFTFQTDSE